MKPVVMKVSKVQAVQLRKPKKKLNGKEPTPNTSICDTHKSIWIPADWISKYLVKVGTSED